MLLDLKTLHVYIEGTVGKGECHTGESCIRQNPQEVGLVTVCQFISIIISEADCFLHK